MTLQGCFVDNPWERDRNQNKTRARDRERSAPPAAPPFVRLDETLPSGKPPPLHASDKALESSKISVAHYTMCEDARFSGNHLICGVLVLTYHACAMKIHLREVTHFRHVHFVCKSALFVNPEHAHQLSSRISHEDLQVEKVLSTPDD